jgi:hypothetical protein
LPRNVLSRVCIRSVRARSAPLDRADRLIIGPIKDSDRSDRLRVGPGIQTDPTAFYEELRPIPPGSDRVYRSVLSVKREIV